MKKETYKAKAKEIQWCMDYIEEHLEDDHCAEWADAWNALKVARDRFLEESEKADSDDD